MSKSNQKSVIFKKFTWVNLIFSFSLALVGSLLSPYLERAGFPSWQISLMFTVFPFVNIIFLPFFGKLADSGSRRLVIIFGIFLEIFALLIYLFPDYWYLVVLARLFDALAASLVTLIVLVKIEDNITSRRRGRETGNYLSIGYLGGLIAPPLGALLADFFFIQFPFLVAVVILFCLFVWLLLGDFEHLKHLKLKLSNYSWWEEIKLFLRHRRLRGMGIMGMVMHASNPAMNIFLPLLIVDRLGLPYKAIGAAVSVYGIMHLFQGPIGSLGDRWGHNNMVIAGTLLSALTLGTIGFINEYWLLLIVLFIQGIGTSMWNVSAWSLMSDIGEREKIEGQVLTSYFSIAKVGSFASFLFAAWIVKIWGGFSIIFLFFAAVIIIGNFIAYHYLKS